MSGTSMDGVDAVLVQFTPFQVRGHIHQPFSTVLREELLALQQPGADELHRAAQLARALSEGYASAISRLLQTSNTSTNQVCAVGCHGQTIRHRPDLGYSIQLVDGALLAELSGIDVITDFRSRDLAAGGQGAPLVPAFHAALFASDQADRVIVNIGGIANLTLLPRNGMVRGFDTGPGNMLMDDWCSQHLGTPFDQDGAWAASGTVNPGLLRQMLNEAFLRQAPPKSTGRDLWNRRWLQQQLLDCTLAAADIQATLLALTAITIADAIQQHAASHSEIYLCGGGAQNGQLVAALQTHLAPQSIQTTAALGLPVDQVEAAAFAWLAQQWTLRRAGNLPMVTGAQHPAVLGALYPR